MSIHIDEVLDYLDAHPISGHNGDVESLLEMLHDAYCSYNSIDSDAIRGLFKKVDGVLEMLPSDAAEQLYSLVCDLCVEHEVLAFSHGIVVGMHFMTEVRTLP